MTHAAVAIAAGDTEGKRVSAFSQSTRGKTTPRIFASIPSPDTSPVAMNTNRPEINPRANQADFHQPDFPMSCSRLVVIDDVGSRIASANSVARSPQSRMRSKTPKASPPMSANSHHHQYSARVARPPKSTYLRNPRTTASNGLTIGLVGVFKSGRLPSIPSSQTASQARQATRRRSGLVAGVAARQKVALFEPFEPVR